MGRSFFFLAADAHYTRKLNAELREQTKLLKEVRALEQEHCAGIKRVNIACSDVVIRLANGLGIEMDTESLLTTAVIGRAVYSHIDIEMKMQGGTGGGTETGESDEQEDRD